MQKIHFTKPLPENAFVFFMHQDYQFLFFLLGSEDDPAIYHYSEVKEMNDFQRIYDHFSEFIAKEVDFHIKIQRKHFL